MDRALELAAAAGAEGEVPVGAVVVDHTGSIVAEDHNRREELADPTAHAELLVLSRAARQVGDWRLTGHTLVVTLEPCAMCAGAMVLARLPRLVYAAPDPKAGAGGGIMDLLNHPLLNHRVEVVSGVMAKESAALIRAFFAELRAQGQK